jgi:hypothetical protein
MQAQEGKGAREICNLNFNNFNECSCVLMCCVGCLPPPFLSIELERSRSTCRCFICSNSQLYTVSILLYSLQIYFLVACHKISEYLYDERDFLSGRVDSPVTKSFLGASPSKSSRHPPDALIKTNSSQFFFFLVHAKNAVNLWFSMMMLGCAVLGVISSILVIIGLRKDQREFLAPFIIIMSLDIFVGLVHFVTVIVVGGIKFDPLTGTLFTVDFFILCLNVSSAKNNKVMNFSFVAIVLK